MEAFSTSFDTDMMEDYLKNVRTELLTEERNNGNFSSTKIDLWDKEAGDNDRNAQTTLKVKGLGISGNFDISKNAAIVEVMLNIVKEFKFLKEKYAQLEYDIQIKVNEFEAERYKYEKTMQSTKEENMRCLYKFVALKQE